MCTITTCSMPPADPRLSLGCIYQRDRGTLDQGSKTRAVHQLRRLVARSTVEEYMVDRARRKLVINHVVFSSLDERPKGQGGAATKAGELDDILKYGARQLFEEDEKAGDSAPACRLVSRVVLQFCGVLMSIKRGRDLCNSCGIAVNAACGHRRGG